MTFLKICALTLVCLLLGVPPAHSNDLELGMQALEQGYVRRAIELWKPLAEQGNAEAQFGLGVIYNDAVGVPQDYTEANYWFLRAAEQGYAPAQFNLGNAYKNATGFSEDAGMAVIWWRKAAEQDFAPAQFNLGTALIEGVGIPRDVPAGLQWYRRAAANGHPYAQHYLEEIAARAPAAADSTPTTRTERPAAPVAATPPAPPATRAAADIAPEPPAQNLAVTPAPPARTAESAGADCTHWLESAGGKTHTVQLMASREIASAHAYVARHNLVDTAICSYPVKGSLWHALLFGQYASAGEARAALAALPAAVRADGGYVRRLEEIRSALGRP